MCLALGACFRCLVGLGLTRVGDAGWKIDDGKSAIDGVRPAVAIEKNILINVQNRANACNQWVTKAGGGE
jgi:hypothetical protein